MHHAFGDPGVTLEYRGIVARHDQRRLGGQRPDPFLRLEIRRGVERLRPRDPTQAESLERWLASLEGGFADRILAIDEVIAHAWGRLHATDPLPPVDGLLAATALVNGLTVVTRDTTAFERIGVPYLDPWTYGEP